MTGVPVSAEGPSHPDPGSPRKRPRVDWGHWTDFVKYPAGGSVMLVLMLSLAGATPTVGASVQAAIGGAVLGLSAHLSMCVARSS